MSWKRILLPLLLAVCLVSPPIVIFLGAPLFFIYLKIMSIKVPNDVGFGVASAAALFGYPVVTALASFACSLRANRVFMKEAMVMVTLFTLVGVIVLHKIIFYSFVPLLLLVTLNAIGLVFGSGASFIWMSYKTRVTSMSSYQGQEPPKV